MKLYGINGVTQRDWGIAFTCGICNLSSNIDFICGCGCGGNNRTVIYNNNLEKILLCHSCQAKFKDNPHQFLCNTANCRVLKEEKREYCHRHDENSIIPLDKPKLIEDFMDYSTDENSCVKVRQEFKNDL